MSRSKFLCMDCSVDTGKTGEFYMLKDEVWAKAHPSREGMLCIGCLETRLGREVVPDDFNDSHVNRSASGKYWSQRLTRRLKR